MQLQVVELTFTPQSHGNLIKSNLLKQKKLKKTKTNQTSKEQIVEPETKTELLSSNSNSHQKSEIKRTLSSGPKKIINIVDFSAHSMSPKAIVNTKQQSLGQ